MLKSETTIRRELRAVKLARSRLRRSDFGEESRYYRGEQLDAVEAALQWALGEVNQDFPKRRPGQPMWAHKPPASQRPLVWLMDAECDDANAKAGLLERRKDKR